MIAGDTNTGNSRGAGSRGNYMGGSFIDYWIDEEPIRRLRERRRVIDDAYLMMKLPQRYGSAGEADEEDLGGSFVESVGEEGSQAFHRVGDQ